MEKSYSESTSSGFTAYSPVKQAVQDVYKRQAKGRGHAVQLAAVAGGKVPAQRQRHPGILVACNMCFH